VPKAPALLAGKVIFVTGGADGIGRECALAYAREGAHVVVADKQHDIAQETVAELRVPGLAVYCDLSDGASVEAAIQKGSHPAGGGRAHPKSSGLQELSANRLRGFRPSGLHTGGCSERIPHRQPAGA
jgi:NAD(P)-dependent dehydrogenase (short-subunit alcohol dehydrogenase family)